MSIYEKYQCMYLSPTSKRYLFCLVSYSCHSKTKPLRNSQCKKKKKKKQPMLRASIIQSVKWHHAKMYILQLIFILFNIVFDIYTC